jgi:hypothetical protein
MKKLIKKLFRFINQEAKINENIKTFVLREGIEENSREVELLRSYARTGQQAILDYLIKIGVVLSVEETHNIIVTDGRGALCSRLAGDTTYTGTINYGLLGTGTPNVVNGAHQLVGEVYRKTFASHAASGNVAYIDFFFAATDWNGTATEFGNVIDGTATVNTGKLFSYVATGGWVKTSLQSLFVSCQYTIN